MRGALERLAREAGVEPRWHVRIEKRIPVAAGLGGGSADAAAALVLANRTLPVPVGAERLHALASALGSDVPFFLEPGPKLAEGRGEQLVDVAAAAGLLDGRGDRAGRPQALHGGRVRAVRRARRRNGVRRAAASVARGRRRLPTGRGSGVAATQRSRRGRGRLEPAGHPPSRRRVSRRRERRRAGELRALPDPARRRGRDAPAPVREPVPGSWHPSGNVAAPWARLPLDRVRARQRDGPRTCEPGIPPPTIVDASSSGLYSAREDGAAQIGAQPCPARAGCCSRGEGRSNRWGVAKW